MSIYLDNPSTFGYIVTMSNIEKGKTYRVAAAFGNETFTVEGFETLDWGPQDSRTGTPGVYGIRHAEDRRGKYSYESWERVSDLGSEVR